MKIMTGSQLRAVIQKADIDEIRNMLFSGALDFDTLHYVSRAITLAGYKSPKFNLMCSIISTTSGRESIYQTYVHNGVVYGPDESANRMVQIEYDAYLYPLLRPSEEEIATLGQSGSELLSLIQTNSDVHPDILDATGNDGYYDTLVSCLVQIQYLINKKWADGDDKNAAEQAVNIKSLRACLIDALPTYLDIFSTTIENDCFVGPAASTLNAVFDSVTSYRSSNLVDMLEMFDFFEE